MTLSGTQIASLYADLGVNDTLTPALNTAKGSLNSFRDGVSSVGGNLQSMGTKMTVATAPITAGLGIITAKTQAWDKAMTNAGAILGKTADDMEDIRKEVLAMGTDSVAGPQAVAESYYTIVSGVQDATKHMGILDQAIALSEAGQAELMVTTDGLVAIMNAYAFEADQAGFVSDVFTRTVQKGVGTMDGFVAAMSPIASLTNTVGISFDEVGASMAFMTAQGIPVTQSATSIERAISSLLKPNADMTAALQSMGYESGEVMLQNLGLKGAMEELAIAFDGDVAAMTQAIGSKEALRVALALTKDEADEFFDSYMEGVDGATEASRDIQNEAMVFDQIKSMISGLALEIGNVLLPVIKDILTNHVKPFIQSLLDFVRENPKIVKNIALIAGAFTAVGPSLIGVGTALKVFSGLLGGVGAIIGLITSPVALLVGGIAALGFAIHENIGGLGDVFGPVLEQFQEGMDRVGMSLGWFVDDIQNVGIGEAIKNAFGKGSSIEGHESWIEGILVSFGVGRDAASSFVETTWGIIETFVTTVQNAIDTIFVPAIELIGRVISDVAAFVMPIVAGIGDVIVNTVFPAIAQILNEVVIPAFGRFVEFLSALWDIVSPALMSIKDWFVDTALPAIVGFLEGTFFPILQNVFQFLADAWDFIAPGLLALVAWFLDGENGFVAIIGQGWEAVSQAVTDFIAALEGFWENDLKPIVEPVVAWFLDSENGFLAIVGKGWEVVKAGIDKFVEDLVGFWENTLQPIVQPIVDWFLDGENGFLAIVGKGWEVVQLGIQDFLTWIETLWTDTLQPIVQPIVDWFLDDQNGLLAIVLWGWDKVQEGIQNFLSWIETLWTDTLQPIVQPIVDWFLADDGFIAIVKQGWDVVQEGIQGFIDWVANVWETYIKPVVEPIVTWFTQESGGFRDLVENGWIVVQAGIQGFIDWIKDIWETDIKPKIQPIVDWFTSDDEGFKKIVKGGIEFVTGGFEDLKELIADIWEKVQPGLNALRDGMESIFNWIAVNVLNPVIDLLNGLIDGLNEALRLSNEHLGTNFGFMENIQRFNPGVNITNPDEFWGRVTGGVESRDSGGPGTAGTPYLIGQGAQPELFIPETDGTFIPNADELVCDNH